MAFEPITTQEQLDNIIKERIARAEESARKGFDGWLSPEAVEDRLKDVNSQLATANKALSEAKEKAGSYESEIASRDQQIKEYETASVKSRVAHEMGLSYEATDFLRGETEEDIKKSAESLKNLVGGTIGTPGYKSQKDSSVGEDDNAAYRKMLEEMKGE